MIFSRIFVALSVSAAFLGVALAQNDNNGGNGGNGQNNQNGGGAQLTLNADNVQAASAKDGQDQGEEGVAAGQAASATDDANFINFCTGKTKTNGAQVKGGSCNGIPMGDIPATTNMVSTIITNPTGGCIDANKDFDITLQVANLVAGNFVNPTVAYYSAPQALQGGKIVGHVHVTVQTLGDNLTPNQPPNAVEFVFFKGIDDDGNGAGLLKATVTGGLPAGFFRVCTMSAAANHQPVTMPVAQRGCQDDCVRFEVSENCAASAGNNANAGNDAGNDAGNTAGNGGGNGTSAAGNSSTDRGQKKGQDQRQGQDQQQQQEGSERRGSGRRRSRQRFQVREYVV